MPHKDPIERKKYKRKYYQKHKKALDEKNKQWIKDTPDGFREIQKRYEQTERGKMAVKRKERKFSKTEKAKIGLAKYRKKHRKKLNEKRRQYYLDNPKKVREINKKSRLKHPETQIKNSLAKKYGLTLERYDQMFEAQDGVCVICRKPETRTFKGVATRLQVDHNHKTEQVRGLLCSSCNLKLGHYEDKDFAKKAKKYLNNYKE